MPAGAESGAAQREQGKDAVAEPAPQSRRHPPDELRGKLRALKTEQLISTCAAFRVGSDDDSLAAITRLALRELAQRIQPLEDQLERVVRPARITKATAPDMIAAHGVGPDTASTLLASAGDNPHRLRSESSWAALLGSSPIPASSGKTNRHRLNRGGDRQAGAALGRIATVRLRSDPATRAYVDKRITEGKSKTAAIRCLKRYRPRALRAAPTRSPHLTVGASLTDGRLATPVGGR